VRIIIIIIDYYIAKRRAVMTVPEMTYNMPSVTLNYCTYTPVMGKSQIKSNHDVNQMTTVPDSVVYARNVHLKCTSKLTVSVSAKIRDGTITEINSLTQL